MPRTRLRLCAATPPVLRDAPGLWFPARIYTIYDSSSSLPHACSRRPLLVARVRGRGAQLAPCRSVGGLQVAGVASRRVVGLGAAPTPGWLLRVVLWLCKHTSLPHEFTTWVPTGMDTFMLQDKVSVSEFDTRVYSHNNVGATRHGHAAQGGCDGEGVRHAPPQGEQRAQADILWRGPGGVEGEGAPSSLCSAS